jgi:hypothetical protein
LQQRLRYRTPTPQNSDSYGALRYRSQPPNFKRTACNSAYAIAPQHPQTAIPTERFAIAHNPNFKRSLSQHPQTAIPAERFAIADGNTDLIVTFYQR